MREEFHKSRSGNYLDHRLSHPMVDSPARRREEQDDQVRRISRIGRNFDVKHKPDNYDFPASIDAPYREPPPNSEITEFRRTDRDNIRGKPVVLENDFGTNRPKSDDEIRAHNARILSVRRLKESNHGNQT